VVLITILTVLLIFICIALIGLILIQQGKGGGLVAFGSGGVEQAFGTHAATLAQKATATLGVAFLALVVILGLLHRGVSLPQPAASQESPSQSGSPEPAPSGEAPEAPAETE